ncbi:MAG: response regulator [Bacteroidetes bacterium]|nr:response regulator [Bacteroidota bacterium]MBK8363549.1 response regulator [Bacteroidota bacterium]MBK9414684.1 response regulator [Bacteroidota bacterium]MBP6427189.1 response regulator [Bacteroidia bacterium]MBP6657479.1 response regulator [Bacteroidia bacterium]
MRKIINNLILADDDDEDSTFFQIALDELFYSAKLKVVRNGVQLMDLLSSTSASSYDILFLDLNLPIKSGLECLEEIRQNQNLKNLIVVIFSTFFNIEYVQTLYEKGATYYIQKPGDFSKFKKVIQKALVNSAKIDNLQPGREDFILKP